MMNGAVVSSTAVMVMVTALCLALTPTLSGQEVDNWRDTIVVHERGKVMNFDVQRGEWAARPYMLIRPYSEGVAVAVANEDLEKVVDAADKPHVYVDLSGNLALPGAFGFAHSFREGRARVRPIEGRGHGIIDTRGQWIVEPDGDIQPMADASEGAIAFSRLSEERRAEGWIDLDGVVLGEVNGSVQSFGHGLAFAVIDSKFSYADKTGQIRINLEPYDLPQMALDDYVFSNGLAVVDRWDREAERDRVGYIDMNGDVAIELRFQRGYASSNGLACVQRDDGKWIYINPSGEQAFDGEFERARSFDERRAAVRVEGKWGFIDTEGEMIVEPQYYLVDDFVDGYARVVRRFPVEDGKLARRAGWIDRDGELVIPIEVDTRAPF